MSSELRQRLRPQLVETGHRFAIAGFFGGITDTLLMRLTDLFISLPQVPLLLVISFLYKQSFYDFFQRRTGSGVTGIGQPTPFTRWSTSRVRPV